MINRVSDEIKSSYMRRFEQNCVSFSCYFHNHQMSKYHRAKKNYLHMSMPLHRSSNNKLQCITLRTK